MDQIEKSKGYISDEDYKEVRKLTPLPCVDLVFFRVGDSGRLETLLFKRKTGPWEKKICLIGGRQLKGETLGDTIRRQAGEIGVREAKIISPFTDKKFPYVDSGLEQDFLKQATTITVPMEIVRGKPTAGEEVGDPFWCPVDNLPGEIIFHHKEKIEQCAGAVMRKNPKFLGAGYLMGRSRLNR